MPHLVLTDRDGFLTAETAAGGRANLDGVCLPLRSAADDGFARRGLPGARRAELATALGAVRGPVSGFPQRLGGGSDARPRPQRHDRDMARSFLFVSSFNPEAARRAVLASSLELDLDVLGASAFTLDEAGLMRSADDLERTLPLP